MNLLETISSLPGVVLDHMGTWSFLLIVAVVAVFLTLVTLSLFRPHRAVSIRRQFERKAPFVLLGLGLLIFLFSSLAFGLQEEDNLLSFAVTAYETTQIFSLNTDPDRISKKDETPPGPPAKALSPEERKKRDVSSLLLVGAMFCSSLFVLILGFSAIATLFRHAFDNLLLMTISRHVVICGLGRIGREIFSDLIKTEKKRWIVVIEPDAENDYIEWVRQQGGLVVIGDATREEVLVAASIRAADEIFLVMGHDETNIEAAIEARDLLKSKGRSQGIAFWRKPSALRCSLHILNRDLASIVRIQSNDMETDDQIIRIDVFNALERTARRLIEDIVGLDVGEQRHPLRPTRHDEVSHFVILGFEEFGQTLALQLAEQAHFENLKRLRMTILDHDIAKKAKPFQSRYPRFAPESTGLDPWHFDPAADSWSSRSLRPAPLACSDDPTAIEYVTNARFCEVYDEITDDEFIANLRRAFERPAGAPPDVPFVRPAILICFAEDGKNFALAERLRQKLRIEGIVDWPIFVWIPEQQELSRLLLDQMDSASQGDSASRAAEKAPLIPFGQCSDSTSYHEITDSWSDWLARYINLAWDQDYRKKTNQPTDPDWNELMQAFDLAKNGRVPPAKLPLSRLDRLSEKLWKGERREAMRASNRSAAIHSVSKLAVYGLEFAENCHTSELRHHAIPDDPSKNDVLRQMEHNRWIAERLLGGWRFGPVEPPAKPGGDPITKNVARQTHSMIIPWEHVPPEFRYKDETIVTVVLGLCRLGILRTQPSDGKPRRATHR